MTDFIPKMIVLTLGEDSPSPLTPPNNLTLTLEETQSIAARYVVKPKYYSKVLTPDGIVLNFKDDMPDSYNGELDFSPLDDESPYVSASLKYKIKYSALVDAEVIEKDLEIKATYRTPNTVFSSSLSSLNKSSQIKGSFTLSKVSYSSLVGAETHLTGVLKVPAFKGSSRIGSPTLVSTLGSTLRKVKYGSLLSYDPDMSTALTNDFISSYFVSRLKVEGCTVFFEKDVALRNMTHSGFSESLQVTCANASFFEKYGRSEALCVSYYEKQEGLFTRGTMPSETTVRFNESITIPWESAAPLSKENKHAVNKLLKNFVGVSFLQETQSKLQSNVLHRSYIARPYTTAKDIWYESQMPPPKGSSYRPRPPKPPEPMYLGVGEMCFCEEIIPLLEMSLYTNGTLVTKKTKYFSYRTVPTLEFALDCSCAYNPRYYNVENSISLKRKDTGQEIPVTSITVQTDIDSWCWDFSATVPYSALPLLESDSNGWVILQATINGFSWSFILEDIRESLKFGANSLTLDGRSLTALLSEPYARPSSYNHEQDATALQVAMREAARISEPVYFEWGIVKDGEGWNIPAGAWSYSSKTPIDVLKELVVSVGGVLLSDPDTPLFHVLPRYKTPYWKLHIPSEVVIDNHINMTQAYTSSIKRNNKPAYNGVFVHATTVGVLCQATISGTDGFDLAPMEVNPFINTMEVGQFLAQNILSSYGEQRDVTYTTVLDSTIGLITPTNLVQVSDSSLTPWIGYAKGCTVTATVSGDKVVVMQDVTLEKHIYEPVT